LFIGGSFALKILVTFAVDTEFAPWRKRHDFVPVPLVGPANGSVTKLFRSEEYEDELSVMLTGIGWDLPSQQIALQDLLKDRPDICISAGLAGGLKPAHRHGKVLVARRIQLERNGRSVGSSASLVSAAIECGAEPVDAFVTYGRIVGKSSRKQELADYGDAVEMESYHVLSVARAAHVRAVSVRAISDTLDQDLPLDFGRVVDRRGHVLWARMLREVGGHPGSIPGLIRFGEQSRRAAAKLADFLDDYIEELTTSTLPPAMEAVGTA
jgi:nucleoside phosphorylase